MVAVVLTQGNRAAALQLAVDSLLRSGIHKVVLVWNADGVPDTETNRIASLPEVELRVAGRNLGIPGGRNFGVHYCDGDYIVFLDDDAAVHSKHLASRIREHFITHPKCGAIAFRIVDEENNTQRRHHPRIGKVGLNRPGKVATFAGGACALRRTTFLEAGAFDASFIYAMEEQDLAWRIYGNYSEVHYLPDIRIFHPPSLPSRHPSYLEKTWHNRVVAAYKSLPLWIRPIYLSLHGLRTHRMGLSAGDLMRLSNIARKSVNEKFPLRPAVILKLLRIGRPPIL